MDPFPRIDAASDHSLLVVFGPDIQVQHHRAVLRLTTALLGRRDPRIRNLHPGYSSLLVSFDPRTLSHEELTATLVDLLRSSDASDVSSRCIEIPVCYDPEFGPDLEDVANVHDLSPRDVVGIHTSLEYLVYFLGFSPGFPYMGTVAEEIDTPRLPTPRTHVPAGSVALAGRQTGIYPVASPGGWRILGRTPERLFRPESTTPTRLQMGDRVRFRSITRSEFEELAVARAAGGEV